MNLRLESHLDKDNLYNVSYLFYKKREDDVTTYRLYDEISSEVILETKDRYEFKLRMNIMGINIDCFKVVHYSIYKNCAGGYTSSIIMSKRFTLI